MEFEKDLSRVGFEGMTLGISAVVPEANPVFNEEGHFNRVPEQNNNA
jgi:hypothetical protein